MSRPAKASNDSYNKAFPTRLRNLIEKTNITHKALAEQLGKSRQAISYYCDGSSSPDWETLSKIATFFNTTCDYLVGNCEIPQNDLSIVGAAQILHIDEETADYIANADDSDIPLLVNELISVFKYTPLRDAILYYFKNIYDISTVEEPESNTELVSTLSNIIEQSHFVVLSQHDSILYNIRSFSDRLARGFALLYGFDDGELY